jgi:hypothetical protein
MEKRNRITYFKTGVFVGMIRSKNNEWNSYGVTINQKKNKETLVDVK